MAAVTALFLALAAIAVSIVRRTYAVVRINGDSMVPALAAGTRVLVRRRSPACVRRGDIVVTTLPADSNFPRIHLGLVVKRVVAVPGDRVPADVRSAVQAAVVPDGALVLRGDNPALSFDSRSVGFFATERLYGIVMRPFPGAGDPQLHHRYPGRRSP